MVFFGDKNPHQQNFPLASLCAGMSDIEGLADSVAAVSTLI
jgi:hypothetical protein